MNFFITGGSRGIGAAIVRRALDAGHDVAFTYHRAGDEARRLVTAAAHGPGRRCRAYQLDVRDATAVERVADEVQTEFGDIQAVVSNAGITRNALVASMTDDEWGEVIQTNLTGAFFVVREFLPGLLERRFGRIVFVSSLGRLGLSGQANYAASKAALLGLSGTLAREYGSRGITSNVVAPGPIETDMTQESLSQLNRTHWTTYNPTRRLGTTDEVAAAVLFLASPEASYISGSCLPVTAGLDWAP